MEEDEDENQRWINFMADEVQRLSGGLAPVRPRRPLGIPRTFLFNGMMGPPVPVLPSRGTMGPPVPVLPAREAAPERSLSPQWSSLSPVTDPELEAVALATAQALVNAELVTALRVRDDHRTFFAEPFEKNLLTLAILGREEAHSIGD